jgi:hypothetical protein
MRKTPSLALPLVLAVAAFTAAAARAEDPSPEVARLVAAFSGDTPLLRDLQALTDEIGGRPTGSAANLRAVDWALGRLREAGVAARKEEFTMPGLWLERSAAAAVRGDGVSFSPRVAAMPFSVSTPPGGATAPLLDAGRGANYHARSDEFDRCDPQQLRLNAGIVAAVTYAFAQGDEVWPRQTRAEIEALAHQTTLEKQMKTFFFWDDWASGKRGRTNRR